MKWFSCIVDRIENDISIAIIM